VLLLLLPLLPGVLWDWGCCLCCSWAKQRNISGLESPSTMLTDADCRCNGQQRCAG
jgi:hypothetical protein